MSGATNVRLATKLSNATLLLAVGASDRGASVDRIRSVVRALNSLDVLLHGQDPLDLRFAGSRPRCIVPVESNRARGIQAREGSLMGRVPRQGSSCLGVRGDDLPAAPN